MRPIRRILVAVKDPAAKTLPAVKKAAQLARAFGAHLELFHGISTPLYIDAYSYEETLPQIEQRIKSEQQARLEKIAARLRARDLSVSVAVAWDFPVYEAILRHSARNGIDLIVAERHAKPHIVPGLLKLTDWELLRNSPVPVLLVKSAAPYKRPVVLAAIDPAHALEKPAKLDSEILGAARAFTDALQGPLHAVHAYMPIIPGTLPRHVIADAQILKLERQTAVAARRRLSQAIQSSGISRSRAHLVGRHPIDAIEQTARRIHSDIVVMGAISRSGIRRFFFGNTAEALLDSLSCDVLIIKAPHFAARVQKRMRGIRYAVTPVLPGI